MGKSPNLKATLGHLDSCSLRVFLCQASLSYHKVLDELNPEVII
jgi:hypothetical protein